MIDESMLFHARCDTDLRGCQEGERASRELNEEKYRSQSAAATAVRQKSEGVEAAVPMGVHTCASAAARRTIRLLVLVYARLECCSLVQAAPFDTH